MKGELCWLAVGQKPRMNPKYRDVGCSAGLHLFQELSTLGQQLAHTLLFRQGLGAILLAWILLVAVHRAIGLFKYFLHRFSLMPICQPNRSIH